MIGRRLPQISADKKSSNLRSRCGHELRNEKTSELVFSLSEPLPLPRPDSWELPSSTEDLERVTDISPYRWKRLDELHGSIAKAPVQQASPAIARRRRMPLASHQLRDLRKLMRKILRQGRRLRMRKHAGQRGCRNGRGKLVCVPHFKQPMQILSSLGVLCVSSESASGR